MEGRIVTPGSVNLMVNRMVGDLWNTIKNQSLPDSLPNDLLLLYS